MRAKISVRGGRRERSASSARIRDPWTAFALTHRRHHPRARLRLAAVAPPSCHPGNNNQCGNFSGYDYSTKLFFVEKSGTTFSAGRYRPGLPELDAVGLVIEKYTASKIVFKLGLPQRPRQFRLASRAR